MGHGLGALLRRPGDETPVPELRLRAQSLADRPVYRIPVDRPVRGRPLRSDDLEAADARRRLHRAARRRCVLGGAAGDGIHRRADPRGGSYRGLQQSGGRSASRGRPDQTARRDRPRLSAGHQPDRQPDAQQRRSADLRERGRRGRLCRSADDVPRRLVPLRQRDRRLHADRSHRECDDVAVRAERRAGRDRSVHRDRHQRRQRQPPCLAAAGAHALPPHAGRMEARRSRAAAGSGASGRRTDTDGVEGSAMTASPATAVADSKEPGPDKGLIERLLSPIADVHRGEATSALLMTATMFLLLYGYYLLKTAREGFILSEGGAEVKSYSSAGQAVMLLALVPAYGALASRVNRVQLIQWVTLFFASNLLLFLLALQSGLRVGIVFFLWVGIFNVMVIAQFWGFAADLYREDQGKRLFPLLGVGSSLGAWIGSIRAGQIVSSQGTARLLIGGAAILVVCVVLARIANGVTARSPTAKA